MTAVTQVQRQISALRKALGAAVIETRARVRRPPRCRRAGPAPVRAAGDRCHEQQRANNQQERSEIQQERIDLAARELASVSDRLQAAADALRESI